MSLREQMILDEREKNEAWDELHPSALPAAAVQYEPAYDEDRFVDRLLAEMRRPAP